MGASNNREIGAGEIVVRVLALNRNHCKANNRVRQLELQLIHHWYNKTRKVNKKHIDLVGRNRIIFVSRC